VPGKVDVAPHRTRIVAALVAAVAACAILSAPARAATSPPVGWWQWPILGPVIRGFEPPSTPFSAGHRGIDIAAPFGTPVRAPAQGTVTFAGYVGGSLFVTIDVGDDYLATSSFLSQVLVKKGQHVSAGDVVALSGRGHPDEDPTHLHFGVRLYGNYVDPIPLLEPQDVVDVVRLAPLDAPNGATSTPERLDAVPYAPAEPFAPVAARLRRDEVATGRP
jgi:murein DD-endopeptidase MepM/ murein hydrolase activator NlpD